jgi:hypothetical protein
MESWTKLVEGQDEYGYVAIYRDLWCNYWVYYYDDDSWELVSWEYAEQLWTKIEEGHSS